MTKKQIEVFRLKTEFPKMSFREIGEKLSIKRQVAHKLYTKVLKKTGGVTKAKNTNQRGVTKKLGGVTKVGDKKPHKVSLHSDSVSFLADIDFEKVPGEIKVLKYCSYKLIKDEKTVIKVFSKKIVVQFRKEIIASSAGEAYNKATKRIMDFSSKAKIDGISKIHSLEQLQRHYAIMGTEIARQRVREGKKLLIYEPGTKNLALFVDFSEKDKKDASPHLETSNVSNGKKYIDTTKAFLEDINFNDHYLPSEVKAVVDTVLNVQSEYAYQIKRHLKVQTETLKTLKLIQEGLKK